MALYEERIGRLEQEQDETATRLYHAEPGSPEHAKLQKEYNDFGREIHALRGKKTEYKDKRDVRHEFLFPPDETRDVRDGSVRQVATATGPLYDPDRVINWDNTSIGAKATRDLRDELRKNGYEIGDDMGHRIAAAQRRLAELPTERRRRHLPRSRTSHARAGGKKSRRAIHDTRRRTFQRKEARQRTELCAKSRRERLEGKFRRRRFLHEFACAPRAHAPFEADRTAAERQTESGQPADRTRFRESARPPSDEAMNLALAEIANRLFADMANDTLWSERRRAHDERGRLLAELAALDRERAAQNQPDAALDYEIAERETLLGMG